MSRRAATAPPSDQGAALARETHALLGEVGAMLTATAEWAEVEVAAGAPPRWVVQQLIMAERLIAGATRGQVAAI
jgi:hypothetical protein